MEIVRRIVLSKKVILSTIGSILLAFGANEGLSEVVLEGITVLFGILVTVQGALDYKNGSKSDGTA